MTSGLGYRVDERPGNFENARNVDPILRFGRYPAPQDQGLTSSTDRSVPRASGLFSAQERTALAERRIIAAAKVPRLPPCGLLGGTFYSMSRRAGRLTTGVGRTSGAGSTAPRILLRTPRQLGCALALDVTAASTEARGIVRGAVRLAGGRPINGALPLESHAAKSTHSGRAEVWAGDSHYSEPTGPRPAPVSTASFHHALDKPWSYENYEDRVLHALAGSRRKIAPAT